MRRISIGLSILLSLFLPLHGFIDQFKKFELANNRKYNSPSERNFRMKVFQQNLAIISGSGGKVKLGFSLEGPSFKKVINEFADLSPEEFKKYYLLPSNLLYRNTPTAQGPKLRLGASSSPGPRARLLASSPRLLQSLNVPQRANWQQFIGPVPNQQRCNACYAFATTSLIEAHHKMRKGGSIRLSAQEIVDCSLENLNCVGGQPAAAMGYIIRNSISYDRDYPYIAARNPSCLARTGRRLQAWGGVNVLRPFPQNQMPYPPPPSSFPPPFPPTFNPNVQRPQPYPNLPFPNAPFPNAPFPNTPYPSAPYPTPVLMPSNGMNPPEFYSSPGARYSELRGYQRIPMNMLGLLQHLSRGPIIVAMYVSDHFKFYGSGIYDGEGCTGYETANHAILAIGYDLTASPPYILMQNSWGERWGDRGYVKITIGPISSSSQGVCLIAGTPFGVTPSF